MRETIQRWEPEAGMWMERKAVGLYVTYSDHIERIAAVEARISLLEKALRNYADPSAWNWDGDGYSWNGSELDYRVPPHEIAQRALESK